MSAMQADLGGEAGACAPVVTPPKRPARRRRHGRERLAVPVLADMLDLPVERPVV
jgi:hypothetical protein